MLGVRRENKFSPAHTQQVVDPHQPQNPLVIYNPSSPNQFVMHAPIAISRPLERDLLNLAAQIHVGFLTWRAQPVTVISRSAHARYLAEPVHRCLPFPGFADLLVEPVLPLATAGNGCSLKCRKAFFKKSISIVICPIFRSNWAISSASPLGCGRVPIPGNANSPFASHSPFQASSRFGLI